MLGRKRTKGRRVSRTRAGPAPEQQQQGAHSAAAVVVELVHVLGPSQRGASFVSIFVEPRAERAAEVGLKPRSLKRRVEIVEQL